jgi:hypothetical protein
MIVDTVPTAKRTTRSSKRAKIGRIDADQVRTGPILELDLPTDAPFEAGFCIEVAMLPEREGYRAEISMSFSMHSTADVEPRLGLVTSDCR